MRLRAPCTWIKVQERRHPGTPRGKQVPGSVGDQAAHRATWCPQGHNIQRKGFRTPIYLLGTRSLAGRGSPSGRRGNGHTAEGNRAGAGPCSQKPPDGVVYCQPPVCRRSPSSGPGVNPSPRQTRTLLTDGSRPLLASSPPLSGRCRLQAGLGLVVVECQATPPPSVLLSLETPFPTPFLYLCHFLPQHLPGQRAQGEPLRLPSPTVAAHHVAARAAVEAQVQNLCLSVELYELEFHTAKTLHGHSSFTEWG